MWSHNLHCYARDVKSEDPRARIQRLLVTGDNRLKQGVDPQKARESYEQALAAAREAGLEDSVRPAAEVASRSNRSSEQSSDELIDGVA
jgi:deoxyribodipyrimidine photolyase-like uncharacterized protein